MDIFSTLSKNNNIFIIENIKLIIPDNFDIYIINDFYKYDDISIVKFFFKKIYSIIIKNKSKLIIVTILPQQVDSYWYTLFLPILNEKLKKSLLSLDIINDLLYLSGLRVLNKSIINKLSDIDDKFYYEINNLDHKIIYENDPIISLINKKEIYILKKQLINKKLGKRVALLDTYKDLFGYKLILTIGH